VRVASIEGDDPQAGTPDGKRKSRTTPDFVGISKLGWRGRREPL